MHGRYAITNDDMRYVLSTFIYDPIAWLDRYGWRRLTDAERLAAFHFYREVGKRMGFRDIPESFDEFREFKAAYEERHFVYSDTNRRIGEYTVGLFCGWFPRFLRPMVRVAVRGMLDPPMLAAFGFAPAPRWVTAAGEFGLKARARFVRWMPARRRSKLGVAPRNRTYPGYPTGYELSAMGAPPPPPDIEARFLRRSP